MSTLFYKTFFGSDYEENKEPTADELRNAITVLEDKIKELEKPKYTSRQQEFLDENSWKYKGMRVMAYSNNKACRVLDEEEVENYAKGVDTFKAYNVKTYELFVAWDQVPMIEINGEHYVHWDRL